MPIYRIEQYELHTETYQLEADSEAEAIKKMFDGEGEVVDGGMEFIEVDDEMGLPVDEYKELTEALRAINVTVDENVIPSIRSIEQIE